MLIVAGTVTDKLAPLVLRAYQRMPERRYVISFGACSNSGGPYWDSYCVTKGVDQFIPVDLYVPGCPPRPEALAHGILRLRDKIQGNERDGWRSRYDAVGTEELLPEQTAHEGAGINIFKAGDTAGA